MVDITALPDQAQVERIRERLWIAREFGRAAVMVGSGFSRNAERRSASDPPFPLWGDIASAMHEALYPSTSVEEPAEEDESSRAAAGAGAVRLASEYQAVFGRPDLNELLLRLIPDALHEPGYLHEFLLSLPWSDVFTTNYDTLIERARPAVTDRKYDLVFTASDVPAQTKPRIVKLHGSFPSHHPFIITEEDYRTYPTKFAPFVNMVQQSIMENAFCLVGFSGDDPNFLRWSGWVRDNLGPAAPPIYLCGVLDLSNSQRRLLEDRKVIPVDLAPLFPTERWPDPDERRARALEWFLLNLKEGESPTVMDWPLPRRVPPIERSEGLPPVPPGPRPISNPGPEAPENRVLSPDDINLNEVKELHKVWRKKRLKEYPGWVVAPEKNRRSLWRFTKEWINPVLWSFDRLPPPDNLCLLYELNWRLETSLVPLFTDWHEKIEQVLNSYNPYPHLVEIESATVKPTEAAYKSLDWNFIAECWVTLAFALAREAREDQEEGRFRFWMDRIKDVAQRRDEWRARWFYEECLFHLFRLDEESVRATLEMWPESGRLPFWEVKRASIVSSRTWRYAGSGQKNR